jgi:uncharacterized protein with PIN domain
MAGLNKAEALELVQKQAEEIKRLREQLGKAQFIAYAAIDLVDADNADRDTQAQWYELYGAVRKHRAVVDLRASARMDGPA